MLLSPKDQMHLDAAEGYTALGLNLDANAELEEITADVRHVPKVLKVRFVVYSALEKWELAEIVAERLVAAERDKPLWHLSLATAMYRTRGMEAAASILRIAVEELPRAASLQYHLAQYECLLGELLGLKAPRAASARLILWSARPVDEPPRSGIFSHSAPV
jgi:predicted Zn-dependent protease